MKIIGVTGGIGAGKSIVSALFAECGGAVIDADRISRELMRKGQPMYCETVAAFGNEILRQDSEIDRQALANIVFRNAEQLELLNKITHKHIFDEMRRQLKALPQEQIAVLDVPLLFAADFPFECDKTVAVLAEREVRIQRVQERDGMERAGVLRRMENQISDAEYRAAADICIENSGSMEKLRRQVQKIYDGVRNETRA